MYQIPFKDPSDPKWLKIDGKVFRRYDSVKVDKYQALNNSQQ